MSARKTKPAAKKPVKKRQGGVRKKGASVAPEPVSLVGKKTQATPTWVDVTIIKWHGFFRGAMIEIAWNYTRQAFEIHVSGRGIGDAPTVDGAKAQAVAYVLKMQEAL